MIVRRIFQGLLSYMSIFSLSIRRMSVFAYYSILHSILDELEVDQHPVTNRKTLREYCLDLVVVRFLFGLDSYWPKCEVKSLLVIVLTFSSRVFRVSIGSATSSSISNQNSALFLCGEHGCSCNDGRDSGGGRGHNEKSLVVVENFVNVAITHLIIIGINIKN